MRLPSFNGSSWNSYISVDSLREDGFRELKVDDDGKTRLAELAWMNAATAPPSENGSPGKQQQRTMRATRSFISTLRINGGEDAGDHDDETATVAVHSKYWIVNHTGKKIRYKMGSMVIISAPKCFSVFVDTVVDIVIDLCN